MARNSNFQITYLCYKHTKNPYFNMEITILEDLDVNASDFYNVLHDEIDNDMAKLKKSVEMLKNLRLTSAEIEVETAAMYHAELFFNIEQLKQLADEVKALDENKSDTVP
ncbi:uncharacterized protein LOC114247773 [Bombyx mandarina]|uniref:Uncharacterized protein LOC114247773 n=1 Tax=Bombyx mandarina TaxID=7092 RepID=A0A6J2K4T3_BOMMA|nr:uncharacterized protein LOC114247773 [Bombyx mandarina]